jgi:hypothetical protein
MSELNESEARQVKEILKALPHGHPAHTAYREGRSLIDIEHCVTGMQPEVLGALLQLNVARRRRLLAGRHERSINRRHLHGGRA